MIDRGWILPEVIDPPDSFTVCICVPNEINYIAAFWGALQELGYQHNWQRDAGHNALAVSTKWNAILTAANERANGMPLSCFTCEELAACITPLLEAQSREFARMLANSKFGSDQIPGEPMTPEERATDLAAGTNPTCDLDILCGQAGNLIEYWIETITDILQKAEEATNTAEFADVITSITGIDELSADTITGYITFVQDAIAEGYAGAVTIAYKEEVQCALWCKSKHDCEITPDDLYEVFRDRVEQHLGSPLPAFNTLLDLFQFMYGVPMDSTIIPDVMHLIVAGGGVLANVFMGDVGVKPLQILMAMWKDEPDNNCSIVCDCPDVFTVDATVDPFVTDGVDSGFDATTGIELSIEADGLWNGGAGGDVNADGFPPAAGTGFRDPTANTYQLIAKIGVSGTWFPVGTALVFTPGTSGRLYFALNDLPTAYPDNSGSLTVSIVET